MSTESVKMDEEEIKTHNNKVVSEICDFFCDIYKNKNKDNIRLEELFNESVEKNIMKDNFVEKRLDGNNGGIEDIKKRIKEAILRLFKNDSSQKSIEKRMFAKIIDKNVNMYDLNKTQITDFDDISEHNF